MNMMMMRADALGKHSAAGGPLDNEPAVALIFHKYDFNRLSIFKF
jgi:hypothetical protein